MLFCGVVMFPEEIFVIVAVVGVVVVVEVVVAVIVVIVVKVVVTVNAFWKLHTELRRMHVVIYRMPVCDFAVWWYFRK